MPFKGLSWSRIKEHLRKCSWIYGVGFVVCLLLTNLIYTSTRPQVPPEKSVLIYVVDSYADTDAMNAAAGPLLEEMRAQDETLEELRFEWIQYNDPTTDYTSAMLLMTRMALGEGDVYLCSSLAVDAVAGSGVGMPLDDYLASGWLSEYDLEPCYFTNEDTGEDEFVALKLDNVDALRELGWFNNEDAYLVMAYGSTNAETSKATVEAFIRGLMEGEYAPAESTEPAA